MLFNATLFDVHERGSGVRFDLIEICVTLRADSMRPLTFISCLKQATDLAAQ